MKINIKATNIELTPAISEYVEKKVSSLNKFFENVPDTVAQVEVGRTTQHHKSGDVFKAEIHITGPAIDLYAVSENSDLYAAIDLVKDELSRNASHQKGKNETITRRGARIMKDVMRGLNPFRRK